MVTKFWNWMCCRLKELQQAMVGGEAADNEQVKERRRKKKKYAEEHKKKLQGELAIARHCSNCQSTIFMQRPWLRWMARKSCSAFMTTCRKNSK